MLALNALIPSAIRLRQELQRKEGEIAHLRQALDKCRNELVDPQYAVLKVFLPQLGCDNDVADQLRLALLELERLQPQEIEKNPAIALRLCVADRYLQHVRHVVTGQPKQPLSAPWLQSAQGKADI